MFGLDLDMASIRRDVDGFRTELVMIRKLLERLLEIEESK